MKNFALMAAALLLGATLSIGDAEAAKRFGGGSLDRHATPVGRPEQILDLDAGTKPASRSQSGAASVGRARRRTAGATQAFMDGAARRSGRRSWPGRAGLTLRFWRTNGQHAHDRPAGDGRSRRDRLHHAWCRRTGAGERAAVCGYRLRVTSASVALMPAEPLAGGSSAPAAAAVCPAGFDAEAFIRTAKVNFIRLQAANDAGNLDDIREFTSPEMFAEIKMQMGERGQAKQEPTLPSSMPKYSMLPTKASATSSVRCCR